MRRWVISKSSEKPAWVIPRHIPVAGTKAGMFTITMYFSRIFLCLCCFFYLPAYAGQDALSEKTVEDIRNRFGCAQIFIEGEISPRLSGHPILLECIKGAELTHKRVSYIEVAAGSQREYKTRAEFGRRFAPLKNQDEYFVIAMAFTRAKPMAALALPDGYKVLVRRLKPSEAVKSGDGYRVNIFESSPQQGQCEVPGVYEIVVQVWSDGLNREIRRTKIYESKEKKTICKD